MEKQFKLSIDNPHIVADIQLEASKSESNRALIIQALSNEPIVLENLSKANDTELLRRLLNQSSGGFNAEDAGTTFRFLTAYLSLHPGVQLLTGTQRMKKRPIKILVDALNALGANIKYLDKEGFPPLEIGEFRSQRLSTLHIEPSVSSQYISALIMIAPLLADGLVLVLNGKISSRPYIQMTLDLMEQFGIEYNWDGNTIEIPNQTYHRGVYTIESDWSGASYWYSLLALADSGELILRGLRKDSLQGDSVIAEIMSSLGVQTEYIEAGVKLTKSKPSNTFSYDFSNCPDLAQTVIVLCAIHKIRGTFKGLESLRIKETDRIFALQTELKKFGIHLNETKENCLELIGERPVFNDSIEINTYEDHRMAMAFAPLVLKSPLYINHPSVVKKSYPKFWEDLRLTGIDVSQTMEDVCE